MPKSRVVEVRDDVELTNLDQPILDGSDITKRRLVDYLDGVADRLLPGLAERALSVIRARPGQRPFMQKNLPDYAPDWIPHIDVWSETSHRTVHYPLCQDRRTLLWLANQRAVEYHPALLDDVGRQSVLVIDLDPPEGADFTAVITVAQAVHEVLDRCGLAAAVKTSGSKGVHIVVPVDRSHAVDDIAAATRALAARTADLDPDHATVAYVKDEREGKVFVDSTRAGGATVVAAYSPRARPGLPVSFPVGWSELPDVRPADFTVETALDRLAGGDPWKQLMPADQTLPAELITEGNQIPIARVAAMHEGKRRKRAQET
ncbi:DNA polymerase domain-containing protein [Microlunatus soli]|uniref:DNA ligase D, polymerase domain-containing protein n=1 Tax=Microlunatus soli TaxID=630515 RepID=A0A1H1YFC5_9ACTN|nr:ATP-dependent DNA ligase [Microlunatus soli]SDT20137.1 DNA ligase D, polymerase domain-containing protein [Microlunatus soli]